MAQLVLGFRNKEVGDKHKGKRRGCEIPLWYYKQRYREGI